MATDHRGQPLHAGKRTADEQHQQMTAEQQYHASREATDKLFGYTPTNSDPKSLSQLVGATPDPKHVSKRDYQPNLPPGTWVFPLKQDPLNPHDPSSEPFQA